MRYRFELLIRCDISLRRELLVKYVYLIIFDIIYEYVPFMHGMIASMLSFSRYAHDF